MALDPRIILAGQTPDTIGAYGRGLGVGQARNQVGRENALAQLYAAQGPGIVAGETGALNALAGMDPMAALGVQGQRLGMDATRQGMGLQADAAKRAAAEYARSLSAEQRAAEAAKLEAGLKGAAFFYQKQDRAGYDGFLRQSGLDPARFPFDQFPATAAQVGSVLEVMKGFEPEQVEPMSAAGKFAWDQRRGFVPKDQQYAPGGVTVNTGDMGGQRAQIGTVPQGFAVIPDPDSPAGYRMARIPGGPEDTAAQRAAQAGARDIAGGVIMTAADAARQAAKSSGLATGLASPVMGRIPTTAAAEVQRQVDVLKANATVENLTAMRQASPTGGALGAVTEKEGAMLAAKSGALDPSSPNFLRDLDDYELTLLQVIHGPDAGAQVFQSTRKGDGARQPTAPVLDPGDDPLEIFQ